MTIHAIVPAKSLPLGKSRLSHLLPPEQRQTLVTTLLEHTLLVLSQSKLAQIWVISQDKKVWSLARPYQAQVVHEQADGNKDNLNQAVTQATQVALRAGATGVLILPADLPLLTPADIDHLLTNFSPPQLLICPDRHHTGTNALLLSPPQHFTFHYGLNSYQQHLQEAHHHRLPAITLHNPHIQFDLDTDADWYQYQYQPLNMASLP